jgi:hypothetical protein
LLEKYPLIEIEGRKLISEGKLKKGIVYDTIIAHGNLVKLVQ